ncbi:hypothetical protein FRC04_000050 [Tulasnella sp. 424]|nr:hypothetical protein FRC04_000050 [Tulasnella sp. 424]KAG8981912.1 hypothetical protein FRC05_000054 [Tulasnella sp. 425]
MSKTVTEEVKAEVKEQVNSTVEDVQKAADDNLDTIDTNARYMAYGARIRTALRASTRYIAYTSDIGEAFRPVVPPWLVTGGYAISWLYLGVDVSYESYKAYRQGPTPIEAANFSETTRIGMLATKRAVFQSIASMALPAFTIHTVVKQAGKAFKNVQNPRLKIWGPTFIGLSCVPALPYLFDHPVEHLTDKAFEALEDAYLASKRRQEELKVKKEL